MQSDPSRQTIITWA
ncbi:Protein of unknown function [Pyronema omphalodes CBS 100304]|uniref:Uncharacterized protein n=1 Tax=Pyronema omphalodes (strain CBS 100304) TaxID=1076935 RepID=U4KVK5_PYROM|nr:Protein of unknown function [Pyronema omphalodes CBS 100304]